MADQSHHWSEAALRYEQEFVDPYHRARDNLLQEALAAIPESTSKTVADIGCGIGPLLPYLASQFAQVYAIDFAPGMLERAQERCVRQTNIEYLQRDLVDLSPLANRLDVAVAVNSLVQPSIAHIESALTEIYNALRPGGIFLGIVPAMDSVHYQTMLLVDRARRTGMPEDAARKNAAAHGEHHYYNFAFGDFYYRGLEQHFWQPFEIPYRLKRAGFRNLRRRRFRLDPGQFACTRDLRRYPAPWDWFFSAEKPQCAR